MFIQMKGEKEWKYRYAILNRNVLDMYEAVEKGFLPLLDGAVEANTGRPFAFSIRSSLKGVSSGTDSRSRIARSAGFHRQDTVMHLQASDADVMETWVDALSHEIEVRSLVRPAANAYPTPL